MKKLLALTALLLAVACGGNFSNADIEFYYALPDREELSSKLPRGDGASSTSHPGEEGLRQRQQALLGDISELYTGTRAASDTFNSGLEALLALIDGVRQYPPTTRSAVQRVWGPFSPPELPGFQVRVVMDRMAPEAFTYQLDVLHSSGPDTGWFTFILGSYQESGVLGQGRGTIRLDARGARDYGLPTDPNTQALDILEASYVTDRSPIEVRMHWVLAPGGDFTELTYAYQEDVDRGGAMGFELQKAGAVGSSVSVFRVRSRWLPVGRGRADATIISGDGVGAQQVDCWGDDFRLRYQVKTWDGIRLGDPFSCIAPAPGTL